MKTLEQMNCELRSSTEFGIVLNEQERGAFFAALLSSHKPSTSAQNMAKRYQELFQTE